MGERWSRSRARRRAGVEHAALQLFAEHGYDATTVAQVAEAAGVSSRTVSLYFPSKLDLALSYSTDSAQRLTDACVERQPGETTLDILEFWMQGEADDYGETIALHRAMLATNPGLRGAATPAMTANRVTIHVALAADLGRAPDDPVAMFVSGALAGGFSAMLQTGHGSGRYDGAIQVIRAMMRAARAV